jgi:hypothetical protein
MNFKLSIFFFVMISYCEPPREPECKILLPRIEQSYENISLGKKGLTTNQHMKLLIRADETGCFD